MTERVFTGGHKTFDTGERDEHGLPIYRHEPITETEAKALWKGMEKAQKERAARMPDEQSAIDAMQEAWTRLKELGWNDSRYCPKDGTSFKIIELGSTGIFDCRYQGEWPDGMYMVSDDRDIYPTSCGVAMYKLLPADEEKRKQRMAEAATRLKAMRDDSPCGECHLPPDELCDICGKRAPAVSSHNSGDAA